MIAKSKKRITITIPKTLEKYLRERAKKFNKKISTIVTTALDYCFYEFEDDYPWEKVKEELKNDQSKK